ncbi:hypothetical protein ADUPG1_000316 [Aduncisulcus paluster]|uniref:Uncharacterized protein n=1 Tax=Aduncisulcus paluster TaxID=2918883 RepID=A0ABQ5KAP9_9EUKA|nr:hypothetical protein ADUPG1_000316 [Aduncisulcus paluster]|eukprot:gnl/Carplike_NY0171/11683_a16707_159.p1 GENE.gnl/Carplike_NY0171/11683_a16707_159~~gnl/Carplike_NY0171/11683_a16707_159.p1  ORF type:complete len:121 (+),score=26.56 gnl/Carplike_NY0171/11683_a16707_159:81-443(+)
MPKSKSNRKISKTSKKKASVDVSKMSQEELSAYLKMLYPNDPVAGDIKIFSIHHTDRLGERTDDKKEAYKAVSADFHDSKPGEKKLAKLAKKKIKEKKIEKDKAMGGTRSTSSEEGIVKL